MGSARVQLGRATSLLVRAREQTDSLFRLLRPDSFYERPIPERHRIVFYLGHLEAFDWNLIARDAFQLPSVNPAFDKLFAFGIDPESTQLPQDRASDWPPIDEVRAYCRKVRENLDALLPDAPEHFISTALEHRYMHAETFAYMLHNLPYEHKLPPPQSSRFVGLAITPATVFIPGGLLSLGRSHGEGFGWDNEYGEYKVDVRPFSIGKDKVTNAEYLQFVNAGAPPPHFWNNHSGHWFYRGMFAEVPLPLDWPVYVTHLEASAYAAWRRKRLPTEAEYHMAVSGSSGAYTPDPDRDNFDFRRWDPVSVLYGTESPSGVCQAVGNGWEWTSTVFHPFPGFRTFDFYPSYSQPFFNGHHYVLKGASQRTSAMLVRPSFRNWFRPSYPYVYATFRLAGE